MTIFVGRLVISYDRGSHKNTEQDLGLDGPKKETVNGGIVRGLGSHYASEEEKKKVEERSAEEQRIRAAFRRRYVCSPIPGFYLIGDSTASKLQEFLDSLEVKEDMDVRVARYALATPDALPPAELAEWQDRVGKQLKLAPLGKGKAPAEEGLKIVEELASCPLIDAETRKKLSALIGDTKLRSDRLAFKRQMNLISVSVDQEPIRIQRHINLEKKEDAYIVEN